MSNKFLILIKNFQVIAGKLINNRHILNLTVSQTCNSRFQTVNFPKFNAKRKLITIPVSSTNLSASISGHNFKSDRIVILKGLGITHLI